MSQLYRIVLAGGGSGGHLVPLVPVAKKIRELLGSDTELLYMGPAGNLEKKIIGDAGIDAKYVMSGKWRRYFDIQNVTDIGKIVIGFFQALYHLYRYMPDAVFSKGSYAAVPVVLAAWIYRIPIMTQDSDAIPGVANKIMGKFADKIAVAYPSAVQFFESGRVAITGNPVREGILEGSVDRARSRYQCSSEKLTLLVLGGSLGSRSMNMAFAKILPKLLDRFFVIHQTGMANIDEMRRRVEEFNLGDLSGRYVLTPFMDIGELSDALSLADLIVSRAGANAIAEIAAVGKPSILIPLPSAANDEQHMNAYEIARVGGAVVLEEVNLGENMLFGKITDIMNDMSFRSKMGTAVRAFYHPDASARIAEGVVDLIRER